MPRIIDGLKDRLKASHPELVSELEHELKSERSSGQPIIYEDNFAETKAVRVTVVWDKWDGLPDEERLATITQAYEEAEGKEFVDRIAVAVGLTVPEAHEAGLLPFQVQTALRKDDPVTADQCREAMLEEGASTLSDSQHPVLRFATRKEAEGCVERLKKRLPESESVWIIGEEVSRFTG